MKQQSTTPVSKRLFTRPLVIATCVLMIVAAPLSIPPKVSAESIDQLNAQIQQLQNQQSQYQASANSLKATENTLQGKVAALQLQQNQMQTQIDLSQAQYDKLQQQIEDTQKQIKDNQDALGSTIADMYIDTKISPLEMLASSKSIGDYVDKQTYQSSISSQLTSTIQKINTLKKQLQDQQSSVKLTLANQSNAKAALADAQAQQQQLLNETQGQESAYQQLISKNQQEQDAISAKVQAAMAATLSSGSVRIIASGSSGGGYPYNCPVDQYAVSPWTDDGGYGCSQCVSYAAWKMGQASGKYPVGWGNADNFPGNARATGFTVSSVPRANSIAFMPPYGPGGAGEVGHVAWVESVSGGTVVVSQYNYNFGTGWGKYSMMSFPASYFSQYIYAN